MDLKRVTRIEHSLKALLADPAANHLTQPQQKEWRTIDIALQHLMQKMSNRETAVQDRPALTQSSFKASPATADAMPVPVSNEAADPQAPLRRDASGSGSEVPQPAIKHQRLPETGSPLDRMLQDLETALSKAETERAAARAGKA